MGRAVQQRSLKGNTNPKIVYVGMFNSDHEDTDKAMQDAVYQWWDESSHAPPRARARETLPPPEFQLLSWSDGHVVFPEALSTKFAAGTPQHKRMMELKAKVKEKCPDMLDSERRGSGATAASAAGGRRPRAAGRPDYTIEGGLQPLDVEREIDLASISAASFKEPKMLGIGLAFSLGVPGLF